MIFESSRHDNDLKRKCQFVEIECWPPAGSHADTSTNKFLRKHTVLTCHGSLSTRLSLISNFLYFSVLGNNLRQSSRIRTGQFGKITLQVWKNSIKALCLAFKCESDIISACRSVSSLVLRPPWLSPSGMLHGKPDTNAGSEFEWTSVLFKTDSCNSHIQFFCFQ